MRRAIVSLTVGDYYSEKWKKLSQKSWENYASKLNCEIIIFSKPLDNSKRAQGRSPAWQKCLVLQEEKIKNYDQIAWLDSDIIINKAAPSIFDNVELEEVGAVDAWRIPDFQSVSLYHQKLQQFLMQKGIEVIDKANTPQEYYRFFGLLPISDRVVQTGVLVLSPEFHSKTCLKVYQDYEDKGSSQWHYEMRPLSYELILNHKMKWLDYRFNSIWGYSLFLHYPFLLKQKKSLLSKFIKDDLYKECLETAFQHSHFLHFAGFHDKMALLNEY